MTATRPTGVDPLRAAGNLDRALDSPVIGQFRLMLTGFAAQ